MRRAVPGQRALAGGKARLQQRAGCEQIQAALRAPHLRHQRLPEVIVEIQIKQRTVQIQQHVIDTCPMGLKQRGGFHGVRYDGDHGPYPATATAQLMYTRIDLHTHSTWSDGALSPAKLVALAAIRQVQLLALTDHDTMAGCASAAQACAEHGIEFLYASELTSLWRGREIHLVGLRLDPCSSALGAHLRGVLEQRIARIHAIGAKLTRCNLDGGAMVGAVLALPGTPTRLHLAQQLVARGHAADVEDAFRRWLARGQRAAVEPEWPAIESVVATIAAAGGLAVLAHPHRYRVSPGGLRELCGQFRDAGGAGIEVSLAGQGPADASRAASLARHFGLAGSCGSDFHIPDLPWRPLGRFAKLPEGVESITERLGLEPEGPKLLAARAPLAS